MRRARAPGVLVLAALWLHQVAIAFLSPLSGEDWGTRLDGPSWPSLGEIYHALIVDSRVAHVVLTPLVVIALILGLATVIRGRRVRLDDRDDAFLLLVTGSLLWLSVPHFGLVCSFRRAVATHLVAATAGVWCVIAFQAAARRDREGRPPGGAWIVALALTALVAGATTRPVATCAVVACAWIAARPLRAGRAWAIAGLAGLLVGAALAWVPDLGVSLGQFADRGLDGNLRYFNNHLRAPAWVVAGVVAIAVVRAAWLSWRGREAEPLDDAALGRIMSAAVTALALTLIALITTDLTMFWLAGPGTAVAVAVGIPLVHFGAGRRLRRTLAIAAVLVQLAVTIASVRVLWISHGDFVERVAILSNAPPGTVASVPPYQFHDSNPWFFGEDFRVSALRDRVATELFDLRGIDVSPALSGQQPVPPLLLQLEQVGGDATAFPTYYSADLSSARTSFASGVARAGSREAHLRVQGITIPDRPRARVDAAWTEGDTVMWWRVTQDGLDLSGNTRLLAGAIGVVEMLAVDLSTGAVQPLARAADGTFALRPSSRMTVGIVECTIDRCALADVIGLY